MKPSIFRYLAPETLDEAVDLLSENGDEAKVLAGGQSLVPMMNLRLARPQALVDLNRIPELVSIQRTPDGVSVGAMTRHHTMVTSDVAADVCPMLGYASKHIGYRAIRHRGTVGGSMAHADPLAELPCVAVTLGAEFVVRGANGQRVLTASDFFLAFFSTALAPDEILTQIRFPALRVTQRWAFKEFARTKGGFALVLVAVLVDLVDGVIRSARIGVGGAADRPLRLSEAEARLIGKAPGEREFRDAAETAAASVDPVGDIHGSGEYRRHLVRVLTERALAEAFSDTDVARA